MRSAAKQRHAWTRHGRRFGGFRGGAPCQGSASACAACSTRVLGAVCVEARDKVTPGSAGGIEIVRADGVAIVFFSFRSDSAWIKWRRKNLGQIRRRVSMGAALMPVWCGKMSSVLASGTPVQVSWSGCPPWLVRDAASHATRLPQILGHRARRCLLIGPKSFGCPAWLRMSDQARLGRTERVFHQEQNGHDRDNRIHYTLLQRNVEELT